MGPLNTGDFGDLPPDVIQLLLQANGGPTGPFVGGGKPTPVTPPFMPGRNPAAMPKLPSPGGLPDPSQQLAQAPPPPEPPAAPSLRDRIMGGLGNAIHGAVDAVATPNEAYGGPGDVARAAQSAFNGQAGRSMQQRALARQAQQDALQQRATDAGIANTAEDTASKIAEREAKATKERAEALRNEAKAEPGDEHKGMQQLDPAWAKQNLPWLVPDAGGQYWVDKTLTNTLAKPETAGKTHVVPAGSTVVDDSGKLLYTAPDKPDPTAKESESQWIADAANPDPAISGPAKAKLQLSITQKKAEHPANVNNIGIPGLTAAVANSPLTGADFLKTLPPGLGAQVKAIAEGRAALPPFGSRGVTAPLRDAVFKYDPNFSEQRGQVRKAFTAGNDGRNIGALNTASVHLDQLGDAAAALDNGSITPGNALKNYLSKTFGDSAPTNFEALKAAVAGELANALKGQATDSEIANISKNVLAAGSPKQLKGFIETNLHTLGAKLNTYQERYRQQIPDDNVWSPVLPSTRAVYQKHGFDPTAAVAPANGTPTGGGMVNMKSPHGQVQSVPANQVEHYKSLGAVVVQ